jgi:membrane-associated phospholipid phosphatase
MIDESNLINYLIYLLDCLGALSPIILLIISIFLLQNKTKYLQVYVVGSILNNILNAILKYAIKEPRPSKDSSVLKIAIANGNRVSYDKYGMPSGHAQNCGFNLAFITLVLNNSFITGLYLVISFITLYQRYNYSNHTILQLIIGFIIGIWFGYMIYYIGNKWIKGNLTMKFDDFAPK